MSKAKVGLSLLAFLLPLLLNATNFIKNDLLTANASKIIEDIGDELSLKTGIHIYADVTNEPFPEKFNLVEYSKKFDSQLSKPYVILIFAPNAIITEKSKQLGRVGLIPSSQDLTSLYNSSRVKDYAIDVVASRDSNTKQDKYNIGVVQSYSELADNIAEFKNVKMTKTIPNETQFVVGILKYIVIFGSLFVLWIFLLRPLYERMKNGKK